MNTTIARLESWVLRAPAARPVLAAMGAMTTRPALFVRVTAADGAGSGTDSSDGVDDVLRWAQVHSSSVWIRLTEGLLHG